LWQVNLSKCSAEVPSCFRCKMRVEIEELIEKTFSMGKLIHHVNSVVKRSEFEPEWVLIESVITEAQNNLLNPLNSIDFRINLDSILKVNKIFIDRILLSQILLNLMTNSVDALQGLKDEAPCIGITATYTNGVMELVVSDNGLGIPSGREESVFEPFYSTKEIGSGIGLSWVKSTLETMGGGFI
jgi:C4-dicarboxylate-specific signal transduction histidine kinase